MGTHLSPQPHPHLSLQGPCFFILGLTPWFILAEQILQWFLKKIVLRKEFFEILPGLKVPLFYLRFG